MSIKIKYWIGSDTYKINEYPIQYDRLSPKSIFGLQTGLGFKNRLNFLNNYSSSYL